MEGRVMMEMRDLKTRNGKPIHQFVSVVEARTLVKSGKGAPSRDRDREKLERHETNEPTE